eukprot:364203-Chlamydomonas_euryale.AAC.8
MAARSAGGPRPATLDPSKARPVVRPPRDGRRKARPVRDPAQDRRQPTHGLVGIVRNGSYRAVQTALLDTLAPAHWSTATSPSLHSHRANAHPREAVTKAGGSEAHRERRSTSPTAAATVPGSSQAPGVAAVCLFLKRGCAEGTHCARGSHGWPFSEARQQRQGPLLTARAAADALRLALSATHWTSRHFSRSARSVRGSHGVAGASRRRRCRACGAAAGEGTRGARADGRCPSGDQQSLRCGEGGGCGPLLRSNRVGGIGGAPARLEQYLGSVRRCPRNLLSPSLAALHSPPGSRGDALSSNRPFAIM